MANTLRLSATLLVVAALLWSPAGVHAKKRDDKTKCPHVKAASNFDLHQFLGRWFVVQYYASSEEALSYRCMRAEFSVATAATVVDVSMNFTYSFVDDPDGERLLGNITWLVPELGRPAHWVHAEDTYEGVYNTYVLDSDYSSWALLLHCAEKSKSPRYLSSFIMSRGKTLKPNVISYLRDKLPRYDVDLQYMFPMNQTCQDTSASASGQERRGGVGLDRDAVASIARSASAPVRDDKDPVKRRVSAEKSSQSL